MEKNNNLNEAFLEVLAESPLFREIEKKELRAMLVCLGGQIKEYKKGTKITLSILAFFNFFCNPQFSGFRFSNF